MKGSRLLNGRNHSIDFFKFLYSWVIVFYHFFRTTTGTWLGGYFAVEYYLLSGGIFLFFAYEKQEEKNTVSTPYQYFIHRFLRFFPWTFTAFLFTAVIQRLVIEHVRSLGEFIDYFSEDIWEILLIKWIGINEGDLMLNAPVWTISSMLIVGFLIWACLYVDKQKFLYLFMPLSLFIGGGIWRHILSDNHQDWIGFANFGTFRAWIVMCLGYYCLHLAKRLSKIQFSCLGTIVLTCIESIIHGSLLWMIYYKNTKYYQWFAILLFILATSIAFSGKSFLERLLKKVNIASFLGKISISIYLIHYPVISMHRLICQKMLFEEEYYYLVFLFIGEVILFSLIHYYLIFRAIGLWRKGWEKLIKLKIV